LNGQVFLVMQKIMHPTRGKLLRAQFDARAAPDRGWGARFRTTAQNAHPCMNLPMRISRLSVETVLHPVQHACTVVRMPAPLQIDWNHLKTLYVKGLTIAEIARQSGLKPATIRAHAMRHGWRADVTAAATALQQVVTHGIVAQGQQWIARMGRFVNRCMDSMEARPDGTTSLRELEMLARVADTFDKIARRNFSLDERASMVNNNVLVMHDRSMAVQSMQAGEVIDVTPLPEHVNGAIESPNGDAAIA
jgi:hypothetical protein